MPAWERCLTDLPEGPVNLFAPSHCPLPEVTFHLAVVLSQSTSENHNCQDSLLLMDFTIFLRCTGEEKQLILGNKDVRIGALKISDLLLNTRGLELLCEEL